MLWALIVVLIMGIAAMFIGLIEGVGEKKLRRIVALIFVLGAAAVLLTEYFSKR